MPTGLAAGQKIGAYTLLEKLGAGGIGEVWKARDRRLNRVVALKFIAASREGSAPAADLLREARAASALNHPNIITIFEVGEAEPGTYLAMEFVQGETLRARLKRPPLPLEEALDIAGQMADGLAAAHREGIVHRDLKPENIMLRADGYVKLLDFGLAKVLPWAQAAATAASTLGGATETGQLVGTFTYMSPEQARGQTVSPASDVFSFGIVLYELLTAAHPFSGTTPLDTLSAILTKEPQPVSARCPSVPAGLREVVERSLRKDPGQRFASVAELREELRHARAAQSAAALAPAAVHRKPRWMQAIGAALIATLLTLAGWFLRPAPRGPATRVQSIAVMTFRAPPEDVRVSGLAQSLPEDLGSALSRAGYLVASRRSVLELAGSADPRSVGTQLGVDAVLEGSLRTAGNKFKVHVELINSRNGFQIWSDSFTAELDEATGGEGRTAEEIARQLKRSLAEPK